jgi:hypothetical protein
MSLDDVESFFASIPELIASHPAVSALVAASLAAWAVVLLTDWTATPSGISFVLGRRVFYTFPYSALAQLADIGVDVDVTVGNTSWSSLDNDPRFDRYLQLVTHPLSDRIALIRKDRTALIVTPRDAERLKRDVLKHWTDESLSDAEAVILKRIAQERADAAEKNR